MNTPLNPLKEAILIPFNEYTVHYFSQSSAPWEAAYINCFQNKGNNDVDQVGYIVFTYPMGTMPPGQENPNMSYYPTNVLNGQVNRLEPERGRDFFLIYYELQRFDDVINQLRYCVNQEGSMFASCDPFNHVWAICNNLHMTSGNQY